MTIAPYGSWVSPISIGELLTTSSGLAAATIDQDQVYWLESRPDQGGRSSLWRRAIAGGEPVELTPHPAYVRDGVHEYGGGEYDVDDGITVYSEFADGRLYRLDDSGPAVPLTAAGTYRYGDIRVHATRRLVLAVREDHTGDGEPENTIVAIALDGSGADAGTVLCRGADFYASPELSAGGQLAWTQWDHPNMPWDSTTVHVGRYDDGTVRDVAVVAGGPAESAVHPDWLGEQLLLVSDRTEWWNLYLHDGAALRPLHATDAEFALPQWVLGQHPYVVVDADHLLCTPNRGGRQQLGLLTVSTGEFEPLTDGDVSIRSLGVGAGTAVVLLGSPLEPTSLQLLDLADRTWTPVREPTGPALDPASVSVAEAVTWTGSAGEVHGWFYPPTSVEFRAPEDTRPPLITLSHGGPTAAATPELRLGYQFWTSRGFAVLDVNYSGSTGYGRPYRQRLQGQWGVVDVEDCAAGAAAMGDQGRADPARLAIKGGSAGGYTTLRALTATDVFTAGISSYGIGDLETLATDTHKFESRYTDGLVGPYPQDRAVYRDRSPIDHLDQLSAPILLLQGLDDKVVPPNQAEQMADAARNKGLPVALILYEGEGHGFRRAETIRSSTEAQLSFLGQVFGFEPADDVPRLTVENLTVPAEG